MIGEYLTGRRNEAGVSIEELSKRTRIRLYYLKALEKEEFHKIPGVTYIKGHIQTYLKALGVDPTEGLKIYYDECAQGQADIPKVVHTSEFTTVNVAYGKPAKSSKYVIAAIVLIVCPVIYLLYNHKIERLHLKTDLINKAQTSAKGFLDTANPSNTDNVSQAAQQTIPQKADDTALNSKEGQLQANHLPAPASAKQHTLSLKASDLTWLSVKIDGKETKQMFLKPLETVEWVADDNFILKLGNAGGVKVVFDGKELEGSWQKGSVVTIQLPPQPSPSEAPAND